MGRLKSYLLFVSKKLVGGWLLLVTSILLCQVHFKNQKLNSTKFNDFSLKFMFFFPPFFFIQKQQKKIQMQPAISIKINAFMKYQTSIGICWYQTLKSELLLLVSDKPIIKVFIPAWYLICQMSRSTRT